MAKKDKEKEMKKRNEKQIGLRLTGTDLAVNQSIGAKPKDVYRSGLYDEQRKKKSKEVIEIQSKIFMVNNRMIDNKLKIQADELLLKELYKDLRKAQGFNESKRNKLIRAIKKEYYAFIENEKYADYGLSDFYEIERNAISIYAMRVGIDYEQAVDVFDKYLEDEVAKQSVLENTKTCEHEDV